MGREEVSDVLLKSILEEDLVKDVGALIVLFGIIPANHEVVPGGAVANRSLVHDHEVVAISEDLLAAFLGLNADDVVVVGWSLEVVLL